MRIKFAVGALLCAGFVAQSAFAGQMYDPNVVPALRFGVSFGGPVARTNPFELALQLQYRGIYTQQVVDSESDKIQLMPLSVEMIRLSGNRSGVNSAYVFSHDLLADNYALNEAGESSGMPRWVWWTIGGVAAAAATVLAVGGGGNDVTINGDSGGGGGGGGDGGNVNCNIVGGTYNISEGDIHPAVLEGCNVPP